MRHHTVFSVKKPAATYTNGLAFHAGFGSNTIIPVDTGQKKGESAFS
jgi:hypothetical protein